MFNIALIILGAAIGILCFLASHVPNRKITKGEVIGKRNTSLRRTDEPEEIVTYIKYRANGQEHMLETKLLPRWIQCGTMVKIAYNEFSPKEAKPCVFTYGYVVSTIMITVGIAMTLFQMNG